MQRTAKGQQDERSGWEHPMSGEPEVHRVALWVCEDCLKDKPGCCNVPGCFFIRWRTDERPSLEDMFQIVTFASAVAQVPSAAGVNPA
jgi:hypothetical protein